MENAVKAIYIAAGMLLGVMILSVLVYIFRQGASLGRNYDIDRQTEQITAFNSQFEKYTGVALQRKNLSKEDYGYSFEEKSNIPSDVVTCANLAYNINRKNEYDVVNHVKVIVKINTNTYYIYPYESQPKNCFLTINETAAKNAAKNSISNTDTSKCKSFYDFLREYNDVKIVNISAKKYNSSGESIYRYYFDVDEDENGHKGMGIQYSDVTGKVNKIVFKAVPTAEFDSLGGGKWSEQL